MKGILILVGALVLANIVYATFFAQPPTLETPAPVDNAATRRGEEPWADRERYSEPARENIRKSTLEALGRPWSSFCTEEGGNRLVASLYHYYWQRYAGCSVMEMRMARPAGATSPRSGQRPMTITSSGSCARPTAAAI